LRKLKDAVGLRHCEARHRFFLYDANTPIDLVVLLDLPL